MYLVHNMKEIGSMHAEVLALPQCFPIVPVIKRIFCSVIETSSYNFVEQSGQPSLRGSTENVA